jgi:predicted nucleic acid-binding protein
VIVVDSNVIAYCWINGDRSPLVHRLRRRDPQWHAPVLWRSEMRSILAGYWRDRSLTETQSRQVMAAAEAGMAGREHHLSSERVFDIVGSTRLSACDCEFVALAIALSVRLVTEDRAILAARPELACSVEQFMAIQ